MIDIPALMHTVQVFPWTPQIDCPQEVAPVMFSGEALAGTDWLPSEIVVPAIFRPSEHPQKDHEAGRHAAIDRAKRLLQSLMEDSYGQGHHWVAKKEESWKALLDTGVVETKRQATRWAQDNVEMNTRWRARSVGETDEYFLIPITAVRPR